MATQPDPLPEDGIARLSGELGRLDVYTYWSVPAGTLSRAGDMIVVGTTGVFLLATWSNPGAFSISRGRPVIDGVPIPGLRALRSDAKRLAARFLKASIPGPVVPVLVLTHGVIGMPRDVRGVRIVMVADLIRELTERSRALDLLRVQRAARVLGVEIPGDAKRHFL
jgi:hypothetical protein